MEGNLSLLEIEIITLKYLNDYGGSKINEILSPYYPDQTIVEGVAEVLYRKGYIGATFCGYHITPSGKEYLCNHLLKKK